MSPAVVLDIVFIVAATVIIAAQHLTICGLQKRLAIYKFWGGK